MNGDTFYCAEQFMMHGKALLFGDAEIAAQILRTKSPGAQKALGRKVANFNDLTWKANRLAIVYAGNYAKFTQNPPLRDALLATGKSLLVEASPRDRIWGIGMSADHPLAHTPSKWRGQNLLGQTLTKLRDALRAEAAEAAEARKS